MTVPVAPVLPVNDAIFTALRTNAPVQAWLHEARWPAAPASDHKVYSGRAPNPDALPYLVFESTAARRGGAGQAFHATAHATLKRLNLWVLGTKERPVLELWALVEPVLAAPLALDAHRVVIVRAALQRTFLDQDGKAYRGIVEYAVDTQAIPEPAS